MNVRDFVSNARASRDCHQSSLICPISQRFNALDYLRRRLLNIDGTCSLSHLPQQLQNPLLHAGQFCIDLMQRARWLVLEEHAVEVDLVAHLPMPPSCSSRSRGPSRLQPRMAAPRAARSDDVFFSGMFSKSFRPGQVRIDACPCRAVGHGRRRSSLPRSAGRSGSGTDCAIQRLILCVWRSRARPSGPRGEDSRGISSSGVALAPLPAFDVVEQAFKTAARSQACVPVQLRLAAKRLVDGLHVVEQVRGRHRGSVALSSIVIW